MKKVFCIIAIAITTCSFAVFTSGCGFHTASVTVEKSKTLRAGMTKQQVLDIMGKPLDEEFCSPNVWYYYTDLRWLDGQPTRDECMPVIFKDGKLAGWGNEYYNQMYFSNQHIK
jgi:outer membrane protein assembly factor BamE (lipoprotein component of BamABCDE complex)